MGLYLARTPKPENNNLTLSRLYKIDYITKIIIYHLKQLIGIHNSPPRESNQKQHQMQTEFLPLFFHACPELHGLIQG